MDLSVRALDLSADPGIFQSAQTARAAFSARRTIRRYLLAPGFKALQIGCGPHHLDGWLNSDLLDNPRRDIFVDMTKTLPMPDASLDAVYASEVIEHVPEADARAFLRDALRVLKPGGVLRLTTPDLAAICGLYLGTNPVATIDQFGTVWKGGIYTPDRWVNAQFRADGHQFIWSLESLASALTDAGFAIVVRCPPRATCSRLPELIKLERHYSEREPSWVYARTLIVEAIKSPKRQPAATNTIQFAPIVSPTPNPREATDENDSRPSDRGGRCGHLERCRSMVAPSPECEVALFI